MWPTFKPSWEKNSTYQVTFSVFNYGDPLYDELDVESSFFLDGQEYVVKNCVENFDTNTKDITAWHVYNEINRIYKRSDLTLNKPTDDTQNQDVSYSVEDILKAWIDGNNLGFSYEVHGNFDKQSTSKFDSGSGKDMLSKILELWPNAIIFPDNKNIRVYSEDEFYKDNGRIIDFPHDAKSVKTTHDSQSIINEIRCVGGKHEVQHTVYTGTGGANASGPTEPVNGDWTPVIQYAASFYGIKPTDQQLNVLRAQIHLESGGREDAQQPGTDPDGDGSGPALGLLQFKQRTFNYYCREPYTNVKHGFDALIAFFNIPNALGQINGVTGWSPHGAPITKDKLIITPPNPWGWPFPNVGEGHFSLGQTFGTHPQDGVGRTNGFHDGLDFGSVDHPGSEVHAIHGGKVQDVGYIAGLENYVTVVSNDYLICYQEAFSSRSNIKVSVGQDIKTGDVIGIRDTSHVHIGITKQKNLMVALRSAWSDDGTWLDPLQIIRDGIGGKDNNDAVGNDTTTESQEEYYFQPFIVKDQKSIDEWGEHPGPDLVDERFQDAEAMRKYALTTLKPDPDLNLEVTLNGNEFVPEANEIVRVIAGKKYSGSYKTVGFTLAPAKGQDNTISLNNTKTTILDYQNQRTKRLEEALDEQRQRMEGLAGSLDQQSKSLTQVVNDKKETDKSMEAVDQNLYWIQNGQHNLVTTMIGGATSSENYNGSPTVEVEQGTLRSNEFNLNGASSISSRLIAKLNADDSSVSASTYIEFLKSDDSSAGKSNVVYIVNNGTWQSAGAVNIKVPVGTAKGRLVFNVSGSGKAYVSRAQVNLGYKATDWDSLK